MTVWTDLKDFDHDILIIVNSEKFHIILKFLFTFTLIQQHTF